MNKTPLYINPIETPNIPYSRMCHWDASVEAFDNQQYYASLTHLLLYINKNILDKGKITSNTTISYPHGSCIIQLSTSDNELKISAPFLNTTHAHKVALYRKIAEINFHPLTLSRIKLKDDLMWFEYKTSIDLVQPNKIYDVLREMCVFADDFDDAFIKQYNANFYQKPQIEHFKPEHDLQIYNDIQTYISDCLSLVDYFEQERMTGFVWDTLATTCFKIADMPGVQGTLRTDIEDQVISLRHNEKIPIENRIAQTKAFLQHLKRQSFDDLAKNFYRSEFFISTKYRSSLSIIQQYLVPYVERKAEELQSGNEKAAFFTMYYAFLSLIYDYNVSKEHFILITNALEATSNIKWDEGVQILDTLITNFSTGDLGYKSSFTTKGFFAKLFTNR